MGVLMAWPLKARGNAVRPRWILLPMLLDLSAVAAVMGIDFRLCCLLIACSSSERMAAFQTNSAHLQIRTQGTVRDKLF